MAGSACSIDDRAAYVRAIAAKGPTSEDAAGGAPGAGGALADDGGTFGLTRSGAGTGGRATAGDAGHTTATLPADTDRSAGGRAVDSGPSDDGELQGSGERADDGEPSTGDSASAGTTGAAGAGGATVGTPAGVGGESGAPSAEGSREGATYLAVGEKIDALNGPYVDRPVGIDDRGDILYTAEGTPCESRESNRLFWARQGEQGYEIHDLTDEPNLADTIPAYATLWPDGDSIVLPRADGHAFMTATLGEDGAVGVPDEGAFSELNPMLGLGAVAYPAVSGDGLTFAFVVNLTDHYVSRRATTSEPFAAPSRLSGDIESFWEISALSYDGLSAYVVKDWITWFFERKSLGDPFVLEETPRLVVISLVISPNAQRTVAAFLPGGCQFADIVTVQAFHSSK